MSGVPPGWTARRAAAVFAVFAFAYLLSALLRAVTATLAPTFSRELGLSAADLGLLAGAYFLGFAATQLPMGAALDRHGPRRVQLALLAVAVGGCAAFALAGGFVALTAARLAIGIGVGACLMGPLTLFRRRFSPQAQLRANSWMLTAGSLGMVASTLPVQALLPLIGWRGLFWVLAAALALATLAIVIVVPRDDPTPPVGGAPAGYATVWREPIFRAHAPMAFFHYGGLIALQALWIGPWLVRVGGAEAAGAARGLFVVNLTMLLAFLGWGALVPRLYAVGWSARRLVRLGVPLSLAVLAAIVWAGPAAGGAAWALFCALSSVLSLTQPAVAQAFSPALAGRALSAYNLLIFLGVFVLQWGIGLAVDGLRALGWSELSAYRGAMALLGVCCTLSYLWFRAALPRPAQAPARQAA